MTNNSTKFQISEYVSKFLFFLSMKSTPEVFIYRGSRKPTVKYRQLYPGESDFSEEFEVPRLNCNRHEQMRGLFKGFFLRSENSVDSKFRGVLV